jgi:4-carboxymuconolactone decarboxylase
MADAEWEKGLVVFDEVYGTGSNKMLDGLTPTPYLNETVKHLFANVWSLPHLSVRDKRLLVVGATTMLGRADLLEIQLAGAILNKELTDEQFEEMLVLMLFYAGAGNTTALQRGIQAAKKRAETLAAG